MRKCPTCCSYCTYYLDFGLSNGKEFYGSGICWLKKTAVESDEKCDEGEVRNEN